MIRNDKLAIDRFFGTNLAAPPPCPFAKLSLPSPQGMFSKANQISSTVNRFFKSAKALSPTRKLGAKVFQFTNSNTHENTYKNLSKNFASKNNTVLSTRFIGDRNGNLHDMLSTLERIKSNKKFPHVRDGSIFKNYEALLPKKDLGYYREFVHPTPGMHGPGPMRLVIGEQGDAWFTMDHYKSFIQIR